MINDIEDCVPLGFNATSCKYADDCTQYKLARGDKFQQSYVRCCDQPRSMGYKQQD